MKYKDILTCKDTLKVNAFRECVKGGPKATRIIIKDHDTNEVLSDTHNKVLISGSQFTAALQWGIDAAVSLPTYNEDFGLDETLDYNTTQPENDPIICLFGIGQGGCGDSAAEVYSVTYTERIEPDYLLPFRYVDEDSDLDEEERDLYFGRYTDDDGMIRYMFKAFESEPQIHMRYLDGTEITNELWKISSEQSAECYVETKLKISRLDFRDYFEQVTGWDSARIDSLGLMFAWYNTVDNYIYYQQILPFSRLNFPVEWMVSLDKAIDFIYCVYY